VSAPRISDGRVVVRVLEEKDVKPYIAAFDEGESLLNLVGYEEIPTRERVERWLGDSWVDPPELQAWEFVVADAKSDAFLGTIMLHSCDWTNMRAELGFWIAARARDQGVGSAALDLLLGWAFGDLGLERIEMTAIGERDRLPHRRKVWLHVRGTPPEAELRAWQASRPAYLGTAQGRRRSLALTKRCVLWPGSDDP
jgi:RimJ/RimL family protein N-acetyltransferase